MDPENFKVLSDEYAQLSLSEHLTGRSKGSNDDNPNRISLPKSSEKSTSIHP